MSRIARLRGQLDLTRLYQKQSFKAAGEVGQRIMQMKLELHYFVDASFLAWAKDDREGILQSVEKFSTMLQELGPRSEPVQSRTFLLKALTDMGESEQALALADPWIEEMRAAGAADAERLLHAAVAEIEVGRGRLAEAKHRLEIVPGTSESPWVVLNLQWTQALIQAAEGDRENAVKAFEAVAREAQSLQFVVLEKQARLQIGIALLGEGRQDEAQAFLQDLRKESEESGFHLLVRKIDTARAHLVAAE